MNEMRIRQKTVVEQVMEKIRELIASGSFGVNDKIPTENELADMFGIGRSSIREAIKVFNYLGILESKTAKGTFVCDRTNISTEALTWAILLGKNDLYEIVEMRESLELWSLLSLTRKYKANPGLVTDSLTILEGEIEHMKEAIAGSDLERLAQADYKFHSIIIRGSDNNLFVSIYEVLRSFMYEEIKKTYQNRENLMLLLEEHQEFIDAIKSGEPHIAQGILQKHIDTIKNKLKKYTQREQKAGT